MLLPCWSFELLPPCVPWCPGGPGFPMGEKLTRLRIHLTRRRVLVYLVNSRGLTQVGASAHVALAFAPRRRTRQQCLSGCAVPLGPSDGPDERSRRTVNW